MSDREIARRNTQALVTVKTDKRLAIPLLATPGEALGEGIDLIVVATGKREQLTDEFFQPSGAPGKTDRSSGKQIGLGNQSSALVGIGLIGRDIDGLLAQTLNETKADLRIFDQKSGRIISPLELHDLFFSASNGKRPRTTSHAIAERPGYRVENVCSCDEHDSAKVDRHAEIIVPESMVLLGIEHFEQRRARIALMPAPPLSISSSIITQLREPTLRI